MNDILNSTEKALVAIAILNQAINHNAPLIVLLKSNPEDLELVHAGNDIEEEHVLICKKLISLANEIVEMHNNFDFIDETTERFYRPLVELMNEEPKTFDEKYVNTIKLN